MCKSNQAVRANGCAKKTSLTRRAAMSGAAAALLLGAAGADPVDAASDRAVAFMKKIRVPLLHAARTASSKQFFKVIQRHADITGISLYSLGAYKDGLASSHRKRYYRGVARYMSRYFALQSKEYRVTEAEVVNKSWREGDSYYVDTNVVLENGAKYSVRWQLKRTKSRFKIVNVRVLGFWLAYFQRQQFQDFIKRRGGSVNALVAALSP